MRRVGACLVCASTKMELSLRGTFDGSVEEADRYFLSEREKAVHGDIWRCAGCGFRFTSPQFSSEEYSAIYARAHSHWASEPSSTRQEYLLRKLGGFASGGRLLDFGCGDGAFVRLAAAFNAVGFEVGAEQGGNWSGQVYRGRLDDARRDLSEFADGSFDVVTAWDVIEHLPDLEADVGALRALLRPGGLLVFSIPNVNSWAAKLQGQAWNSYLLEHLWYFAPDTIDRFLARNGFSKLALRPIGFPARLDLLAKRLKQTYGFALPLPDVARRLVLTFPIGLLLGAYRRA